VLRPECRPALIENGMRIAERHDWRQVAQAHLAAYAEMRDLIHA